MHRDLTVIVLWINTLAFEYWSLKCDWGCVCAQFLNPRIMIRGKGASVPKGHINNWFWEKEDLMQSLPLKISKGTSMQACVVICHWLSVFARNFGCDLELR